jgi:hypothetical protein
MRRIVEGVISPGTPLLGKSHKPLHCFSMENQERLKE